MVLIMGSGTSLAFYVAWRRHSDKNYVPAQDHKGGFVVLCFTVIMCLTYIGAFIGKLVTSLTSIDALLAYDTQLSDLQPSELYFPSVFYPFKAGAVNISSKLY